MVERLRVKDLKALLAARNLPTNGNKSVLQVKLQYALECEEKAKKDKKSMEKTKQSENKRGFVLNDKSTVPSKAVYKSIVADDFFNSAKNSRRKTTKLNSIEKLQKKNKEVDALEYNLYSVRRHSQNFFSGKGTGHKIYVGNVEYHTKEEELVNLFKEQGKILDIIIPRHGKKGKGFVFIEFQSVEGVHKSIKNLNGLTFKGRKLNIEPANEGANFKKVRQKELKIKKEVERRLNELLELEMKKKREAAKKSITSDQKTKSSGKKKSGIKISEKKGTQDGKRNVLKLKSTRQTKRLKSQK